MSFSALRSNKMRASTGSAPATIGPPAASNRQDILVPMRRSRLLFVIALLLGTLPALAASDSADAPHVYVRLIVVPQALSRGANADAGLYFKIEPSWHVYWKNAGDAGEPPNIKWTLPDGITAGSLQFPAPKRLPLGPLMDFGYENQVLFPFTLSASNSASLGNAVLHGKVNWLVCQATCIPGKAELEVARPVLVPAPKAPSSPADAALYKQFAGELPKTMPTSFKAVFQPAGQSFRLEVTTGHSEQQAQFFPADQNILDNPAPQPVTPTAEGLVIDLRKDANLRTDPPQLRGVLELSNGLAFDIAASPGIVAGAPAPAGSASSRAPRPNGSSSATAYNSTGSANTLNSANPASPVNSAQSAGSTGVGLLQITGLAFVGGLLLNLMPCVFPVLFIKGLALVRSGSEERHKLRGLGLVYATGILVSFWVLVGALLGLRAGGSVLGWGFQFQSPVFLSLIAGLLFFLGLSLAGQFEIGLSLTGAGSSLAAKQGYAGGFFTGVLAVLVATPCTAPFMGAAIGYALAQPAAVTFAVFTALALGLAAPYVALTLQPAWTRWLPKPGAWMEVVKQVTAVPIFGTVIWLAWVLADAYGAAMLAALLAGLLLLAIAGWFLGRWPAKGWATAAACVLVAGVVLLNVFAPGRLSVAPSAAASVASQESWQPWTPDRVSRYLSQGRPVFVDFTANWCLSCQVNERVALSRPEVQKAFADANVVLLRADWTQHDDAIAKALAKLGRSGVPTYVLYVPGEQSPQLLPEALTPGIVTEAIARLPHPASQTAESTSNLK